MPRLALLRTILIRLILIIPVLTVIILEAVSCHRSASISRQVSPVNFRPRGFVTFSDVTVYCDNGRLYLSRMTWRTMPAYVGDCEIGWSANLMSDVKDDYFRRVWLVDDRSPWYERWGFVTKWEPSLAKTFRAPADLPANESVRYPVGVQPPLHDVYLHGTWMGVGVPLWAVGLMCLAPALLYAFKAHRRSLRKGMCPHCGYDWRANPERCSECGTIKSGET